MGKSQRQRRGPDARGARAAVGLVLAMALWVAVGLPASDAAETAERAREERVVVLGEGDTLWDLAGSHAPAGVDRHAWVAAVAERNGIDPRRLRAGDALRIPSS